MTKKFTVGVDFGGTNIKFGLVNATGRIVSRTRLATKVFGRDKKRLITAMAETILGLIHKDKLKENNITGVGIGLPGLIDPVKGVVRFLPNVPGWREVPLKRILEQKLGIPVYLENDVNLITLGEWKFGAGKGYADIFCITLGTGVGGGLVLHGQIYRGPAFVAGEVGHLPLNENGPACNCGGWGCFERYVGNQKILAGLRKAFKKPHAKNIYEFYRFAKRGDRRALKLWEEIGTHIGNALVGVVNLLNPQLIIIGGGVSNNYPFFQKKIKEVIKRRAMPVQAKMVRLTRAKLGDGAGIQGAKVLVEELAFAKKK